MTNMAPGWYDDGHGALRWWDGARWTEHVAAPDPEPAAGSAPEPEGIDALPPELAYAEPATPLVPPYAASPGYPGNAAPSGMFTAATQPQKSKTWIWVVAGIALLGVVVAAAVLIPVLLLGAAVSGNSSSSAAPVAPTSADEDAAVATVELYDAAWQDVDCDAFFASTTENFRSPGWPDCATFEAEAEAFATSVQNYQVSVTGIESGEGAITVRTSEAFDSFVDEAGNPADPPVPFEEQLTYTLVPEGDGWAIDNVE
ncbi:DUF2510 domain-containing protein [Microbacterium lacus]|uniref:DUF2510 domain-containing protein n=1 Tax=Microbacterium lacus TaxID=415217 RepID=UPI00384E809B